MKCPHCKVTIACRTNVCPLCHATFNRTNADENAIRRLPRAFPPRSKMAMFSNSLFDKIYIFIAINLLVVAAIVELILTRHLKWCLAFFIGELYVYILFRSTMQAGKSFSSKVVTQAILLTALGFAVQNIIGFAWGSLFVFEYILPSIYLVSLLCEGVNILIFFKSSRVHVISLMSVALLSVMPFIVVLIGRSPAPNTILAVITAATGIVIILSTLIFSAKSIWGELKRLFHI